MSTGPEHKPLHAVDVTMDDVWAVVDFLTPRLESLERAHDGGADEHRAASALAEAVCMFALTIDAEIRGPLTGRVHNPSGRPPAPAPTPTESERIAEERQRLTRIKEYWNQLCAVVEVWRESDGYDLARWQRVSFLDAAAEAEYERLVAEAGLRPRRRS
ncbi:hypothetical protein R6V09_19395 [Streptomyces sp. W16]|uniref:hypothetical protein n=1 Tax=Streptomyces sp. W16 TaxID=3076631 RepID=UPI00295A9C7A|nr:hypothetical protein [Streptomyces sp. W16]MDV9172264.1 hypothetical protein [Streptomyces sp. W16]